jgi:GntR family transcriptional regulator
MDGLITKPESDDRLSLDPFGLTLNSQSFVPFYAQIVEQIRALIREKKLKEGQVFHSEGEIAQLLGISKMPVRQAFQKLRSEGLLVLSKGKRPVIGPGYVPWDFQQLRGFSEEMRRRGLVPSAQVLDIGLEGAELEVAEALKLEPGEQVYRIKRLRFINAKPVAIVSSYIPARIFPGIEKYDLGKESLYDIIENVYKRTLQWAEEEIGASTACGDDAHILQAAVGSALLLIKERTYDVLNTPIEFSVSLLRGDRYTASVTSVRKR